MESRERVRRSNTSDQQNYRRQVSPSSQLEEPYEEENPLGINWRFSRWILLIEVAVFIYQTIARLELLKDAEEIYLRYDAASCATWGLISAVYLTKIWRRKHVSSTAMLLFLLGNVYMFLITTRLK
jgi:hypothetical protein